MYYVYLLRSTVSIEKTYIGFTTNIEDRLEKHNSKGCFYTRDNGPWKLVTYISFDSKAKALAFEKYLKIGSGHAFAKKHFW